MLGNILKSPLVDSPEPSELMKEIRRFVQSLALLLCVEGCVNAQNITDLTIFRLDGSGDAILEGWNTRSDEVFPQVSNAYIKENGNVINSGNGAGTRIALNLSSPGQYTFTFDCDNVNSNTQPLLGINLFTNGNTSIPSISARSLPEGGFVAAGGVTRGAFFNPVSGANSTVFYSDGYQIALTDFSYQSASGSDSVSPFDNLPNGFGDTVGSFTLTVTAVPEPSSLPLLLLLIPLAFIGIRRRTTHES